MASSETNSLAAILSNFGSERMAEVGLSAFFFMLLFSTLCSFFISYLYIQFYSRRATGSQVHRAFPLLGLSITAVFVSIQFSLPLSLGLLGALSIVRFRTPIKEPEEISFIMLVVATSVACATFNYVFVVLLLAIAVLALLVAKFSPRFMTDNTEGGLVLIRLSEQDYLERNQELLDFLQEKLQRGSVEGVAKNGTEFTVSYNFSKLRQGTLVELQALFQKLFQHATIDIFLSRPRSL